MTGVAPFFITGANAKIKLNGKTIAFCTDFSYSVEIAHASPVLLGNYEPANIEPLSYKVTGSFTVIRYIADLASAYKNAGYSIPHGVSDTGNGVGAWGSGGVSLTDGQANKDLDPAALDSSVKFDIQVYQKLATGETYAVSQLRGVRITRADFAMMKRAPTTQRFNFTAIYADEDSFLANASGQGQQFA
jgi:hypothetical protein